MNNVEKATVTVEQAARELGWAPQGVRERMKRRQIDIGEVLPSIQGKRNVYYISRYKLDKYLGKV